MKEKTYKTKKAAIKALKHNESCVYDKDKKKYVTIKMYSEFDDIFTYKKSSEATAIILGAIVGSLFAPVGVIVGGFILGMLYYWFAYRRHL